jgi:hypothetical protein
VKIVYEAKVVCGLLGLPVPEKVPATPPASDDEIIIWSPGLSIQDVRSNPALHDRAVLRDQDWYDPYTWSRQVVPAGYYAVRVPIRGSNRLSFADQVKLLRSGEIPIPVALAALTWCVHRVQTGEDLFKGDFSRCAELALGGRRVEVSLNGGRLFVYIYWGGLPYDYVWLSSSRATS